MMQSLLGVCGPSQTQTLFGPYEKDCVPKMARRDALEKNGPTK